MEKPAELEPRAERADDEWILVVPAKPNDEAAVAFDEWRRLHDPTTSLRSDDVRADLIRDAAGGSVRFWIRRDAYSRLAIAEQAAAESPPPRDHRSLGPDALPQQLASEWAAYTVALHSGLRSQALGHLKAFLSLIEGSPDEVRAGFALWLASAVLATETGGWTWSHRDGAAPMQQPLIRRLFAPFLVAGFNARRNPEVRWLARVMRRHLTEIRAAGLPETVGYIDVLNAALELEPYSPDLWQRLFDYELEPARFGMHHLNEGHLVAPEAECREALAGAEHVVTRAPTGFIDGKRLEELVRLTEKLERWKESDE